MNNFIKRLFLLIVAITISSVGLYSQVRVGTTNYTTLKSAFDAINSGTHTGDVIIKIDSSTVESARAVLNASGGLANYTSVTIYPTDTVSVSGSITTALVELRDADNVTIDGRVNQTGSLNALTFQNNATSSATVIWVNRVSTGNGARNNTLQYLNVIGGIRSNSTVNGITVGSSASLTSGAAGNDSLKIYNNNIMKCYYGIRKIGSSATLRTFGFEVKNNTFGNNGGTDDGHYYAIDFSFTSGAIIDNNSFTIFSTTLIWNIYLRNAANAVVTNNRIFNSSTTSTFYGIYQLTSTGCLIENNSIENCATGAFYAWYLTSTSTGNTWINNSYSNNTSSTVYGLYLLTASANNTFTGHVIRNHTSTSLSYHVYNNNATATNNIYSDFIVENVTATSTLGIVYHNNGPNCTYQNFNIKNVSGAANVYGMYISTGANTKILNNHIENISTSTTSTTISVRGIYINTSSNNVEIVNNSISGIYSASNKTSTMYIPSGIMLWGSTGHKVYYNSINMHGSTNPNNIIEGYTSAITIGQTSVNNLDILNNVLVNTMDNSIVGSKSFSIFLAGTGCLTGTTLNYNDYYVAGSNAVLAGIGTNDYLSIGDWRIATTNQDLNSFNSEPIFNSPTVLNPYIGSPLLGQGTPLPLYTTDQIGFTRSTTAPTPGAFEQVGDFIAPTISYTPLQNTTSTANRNVITVIYDNTGVDTVSKPRIYYKKTTNNNVYLDNTNATNGWKYGEATVTGGAFSFVIDYSKLFGGLAVGESVEYFIVAQDISALQNVVMTSGTTAIPLTSVALTAAHFPITNIETSYSVALAISGTYTVGDGQVFTSLSGSVDGAFNYLRSGVLTGDVFLEINSDILESGEVPLEQIAVEGGSWNVYIYPSGNYTLTGNANPAVLEIRDADRVVIDGRINRQGTTNALTIQNLSTSGTVLWINRGTAPNANGARNNTIQYCNIVGGSPTVTSSHGIVIGSGNALTAGAGGNNNLLITKNNIYRCYYGIRMTGDAANLTSNLQITHNNFGNNGTNLDGHYYGIDISNTTNAQIKYNNIKNRSTTIQYNMYIRTSEYAEVMNNSISGCATTSTFYGIYTQGSNNLNISDNNIDYNSVGAFYGIYLNAVSNSTYNNNTLNYNGGTSFYVMYITTSSTMNTMDGNEISENSPSGLIYGVYNLGTSHFNVYSNFKMHNNISSGSSVIAAIYNTSGMNNIYEGFDINNLRGGSNTYGIWISNGANTIIRNNKLTNIISAGSSLTVGAHGIYISTTSNDCQIYNNSIAGVYDGSNKINNLYIPSGIRIHASTGHQIYYNSVNMHGTSLAANDAPGASTALMIYTLNSTGMDIRNNIFVNTMEGMTGYKAYAAYITSAGSLTGTTLNFNDYFATGTQGVTGYLAADVASLADWRIATTQDANSMAVNPDFNSNSILMPYFNSPISATGTPIPTVDTDINGITRATMAPTIGSYEQVGDFVAPEISFIPFKGTGNISNRSLEATITDRSGVNDQAFAPRIYYRKSTNANTFVDNTATTDGWKYAVGTGAAPTFNFTINIALINGGLAIGDEMEYFIVAQDSTLVQNVGISSGELATTPDNVNLVAANFPINKLSTKYRILPGFSGTINVGQGQAYTSLTNPGGVFSALNNGVLVGDVNVQITSDLEESGTIPLKRIDSDGPVQYFINIYPTTQVSITDPTNSATAILEFSDANYVTLDGRINRTGSSNNLTIENQNSANSTVIWVNRSTEPGNQGSKNIMIRNVNVIGAIATTSTTNCIVVGAGSSLTGAAGGNDNISILYNNIMRAYWGVRMLSSAAQANQAPSVRYNNFGNESTLGDGHYNSIYLNYANEAVIANNVIKQNNSTILYAIQNRYSHNSLVYNNIITNTTTTSTFYGIYSYFCNNAEYFNNEISNISSTASYPVYTYYDNNAIWTNNEIKNIFASSPLYAFYCLYGSNLTAESNKLINLNGSGVTYGIYSIYHMHATLKDNFLSEVKGSTNTFGIYVAGSYYWEDYGGSIYESENPSHYAKVIGNKIENVYKTGTATTSMANGIVIGNTYFYESLDYISADNSSWATVANNEITGIYDAGKKTTAQYIPSGIRIEAGKGHNIVYNSVNLHGNTTASGTANEITSAFTYHRNTSSPSITTATSIINNAFTNTKAGNTGLTAYASYINGTGLLNNVVMDYNNYFVGANGILGFTGANQLTLPDWRTATSKDSNAKNVFPNFNSPYNLRPFDLSPLLASATPLVDFATDKIGITRSLLSPTIGAYEEVGDFNPPTIEFTPLSNTSEFTNRTLSAAITDQSGVNNTTFPPRIYFRKTSNANTYADNTPGTDGWKFTVGAGAGNNYTFTINHNLLFGGLDAGDVIEYFIIAQDNSPVGFTGPSSGTFATHPANVNLTATNFPISGVSTSYNISIPFAGTVDVGVGKVFTSLTNPGGLFESMNSGVLVGNLQVRITSDLTETGAIPLRQVDAQNNQPYTISIYPNGQYTITGTSTQAIIQLSDADRVTIDGRINRTGTANALTIINQSTTGSVIWVNRSNAQGNDGAKYITLRNMNLSMGIETSTNYGIVVGSVAGFTTGAAGMDYITISHNNIYRCYYGVRMTGASGGEMIEPKVNYNRFGNNGTSGDAHYYPIYVYFGNNGEIIGNHINNNRASIFYAIYNWRNYNAEIADNYITGSSTSTFYGIYNYYSDGANINNNLIENVSSTIHYGIYSHYDVGATLDNNTIQNCMGSGVFYPIYAFYGNTCEFTNNKVLNNTNGAISATYGIYIYYHPNATVKGNTIRNLTSLSTISGIYVYSASTATTSANTIVMNNIVENIRKVTSVTTTYAGGITIGLNANNSIIANNVISDIYDVTNITSVTYMPAGLRLHGSINLKVLNNTIIQRDENLNTGISNNAAFLINLTSVNNLDIRNNTFINTRTGVTGSKSYAAYIPGTGSLGGTLINNNNYWVDGQQGVLGFMGGDMQDLTAWRLATTQDLASISVNPQFVGTNDFRPLLISPLLAAGVPLVDNPMDILGVNRSLVAPTIGAYEDGVSIGVPNLVAPANLATNRDVNIGLIWESVFTATGYVLQVSTNISFSTFLFNGPVTGTGQAMMGLMYNSTYYWRVKAVRGTDEGNWSDVWQFTTMPPPLLAPALVSPADLAIDVALNPTMSWNSVFSATGYNVQLSTDSTFATTILNETQTTTTIDVSGLDYSTEYFWRVRALRNTEQGPWSSARMFTTIPIPPLTAPVLASPADAATNVPLDVTLNWNAVGTATAYVMNFSTDNTFATILHEDTLTTTSYDIAALTVSTEYFWRVRALRGTEESNWSSVWSFTTTSGSITQTIPLTSGWNMFSANVTPQNPAMSNILTPLLGNMMLIKNVYGQVFAPPFQASLTNWNTSHAYQARMTTPANLVLEGAPIVPEMTPLTLDQLGWYWLPYYRTSSMPIGNALATIQGKYLQIKSITGQVHQPPFITTLQNLEPNMGYMIRMSATDGTLTYPSNAIIKAGNDPIHIPQPKVFVREAAVTGKTAVIALELDNMQNGDEVGVFTRDGLLVGSSVWANGSRGVVVWGDDEYTNEKDGAAEGEELIVKIWSAEANNIGKVESISLNDMTTNARQFTLTYETDAVYLLKGTADVAEAAKLSISPQPASYELFVNIPYLQDMEYLNQIVSVKLYSQAGQLAIDTEMQASGNVIKLNTSTLSSGVYQMIININGKTYSEKVVIVK